MKERLKSIDSLRGLAILAVLLIHTTTRTLEASGFNISGFSFTIFLNQISRFAVPLFFLISGFVQELGFKEEGYWSFIKKRFSKIFIPYILWSLIYYLLIYNQNHDNFLKVILVGNASYQFYFIPTLCIFYLLFPLLHKLLNFLKKPLILSLLGGVQMYLLFVDYYIKEFVLPDPIHIGILAYFVFILGMLAASNKDKIDRFICKMRVVLPVVSILAGLYVFWEGRGRYLLTGNYLSYYSQWRPSVLIYTVLLGLTLYYFLGGSNRLGSILAKFSQHSFFVFFIHVAILEWIWRLVGLNLFGKVSANLVGKIVFDPIFFGSVALISFVTAYFLHKVPGVKWFLG